jgi:hypothetical protein
MFPDDIVQMVDPRKVGGMARADIRVPFRGLRSVLLVSAVALALVASPAPALASCTPEATGISHSGGAATGDASGCPAASGKPAGGDSGRKIK